MRGIRLFWLSFVRNKPQNIDSNLCVFNKLILFFPDALIKFVLSVILHEYCGTLCYCRRNENAKILSRELLGELQAGSLDL